MASLQILKSAFTPVSIPLPNFPGKWSSESDSRNRFLRFGWCRSSRYYTTKSLRVCCEARDSDNQSNGEEPPESLFMKELRKRGMTPTSLLEETKRSNYGLDNETNLKEEDRGFSNRNAVSTELEKSLSNQRERSMALNSEGLEGLIPRAKLLLTIGGTFFFGFWPLILITVTLFLALYFYFGPTFVHDAGKTPISPPQYIDPYALLEEERISQIAPRVN
ncbi:uncharacterized protein LOC121254848 [Juglans microcarpa x Juglans regia]|uniref:uncharacterized protein LOC121254848 n=1 Tax=Juglans microcarpa x Juglans regia TaxID=2249226 RepID=UPI001B7DCB63|nr:uncharacterized protein LOC121254848 [Juglans microcarpa x Juglans regia]